MPKARASSTRLTGTGRGSSFVGVPGSGLEVLPRPTAMGAHASDQEKPDAAQAPSRRPWLARLADWWVHEDPLEPADALVVLAGDSAAGGRLQRAVELYRQAWAPRLILSGPPLRTYLNEAQLMEQEAMRAGLPHGALLPVAHEGASTLEEATILLRTAAEVGARRLIVVSSNFHVRRMRAIYRALARELGLSVRVAAAPDPRFDAAVWWRHRLGIVTLGLELLKNVLTWLELRRRPFRRLSAAPSTPALPSREATGWFHPHRSPR